MKSAIVATEVKYDISLSDGKARHQHPGFKCSETEQNPWKNVLIVADIQYYNTVTPMLNGVTVESIDIELNKLDSWKIINGY